MPDELYKDINNLRKNPADAEAEADAAALAKLNDSCFAAIVKNKVQEIATLGVIVLNALFLGYDTDYSARWSRPEGLYNQGPLWGFPFMENFFCVYFTLEVTVRFFAFKVKKDCLRDGWMVFDSTLVAVMIGETWILEFVGGGAALPIDMDMLRLLRLCRIARMGKLMRFFPELAIIVKGMVAAVRSVGCTAILMILVLYVFSIIFTDAFHQGKLADDDPDIAPIAGLFGSMGKSFRHLFIMGTILDDITACTNTIRTSDKPEPMMGAFFVFVLVSSFTMLNMLIGILCEVVTATSDGERARNTEMHIREAIGELFKQMDEDGNGNISRAEFMQMKDDVAVREALADLQVEAKHFDMYADLMFQTPEEGQAMPLMTMENTVNMIMRLRPGSKVSALDFASFQQAVFKNHAFIKSQIGRIDKMMTKMNPDAPEEEDVFYDAVGDRPPNAVAEDLERTGKVDGELTMANLTQNFTHDDILEELQKRVGMGLPGNLPGNSLDPTNNTSKMVEAFETLCVPQQDNEEAWSKETYTC